jgi:hypothetical protein
MKDIMPVFFPPDAWKLRRLSCHHYLVDSVFAHFIQLYFRVRVFVCLCSHAPLPLFLVLKYQLCIARHEAY